MKNETLKYIIPIIFLYIVCLSALSFPDNTGKIVFNEDDMIVRLIEKKGSDIKTAEALFLVDSSPIKCHKIINNVLNYPSFMPDIEKTTFVKKTARGTEYDFVYDAPIFDIEYTLLLKDSLKNGIYHIEWSYIKGELNENNGSWEIMTNPEDSTETLIKYKIYLDPGTILPDWLMNRLTAGSIPDMIYSIRKKVKQK
ncbi:MAG: hypothetical protein JXR69_03835 [Candidatus Delongbacteria bacterium]|nr:hypothetical protein [Candidatus Delongbacteria bacterium]